MLVMGSVSSSAPSLGDRFETSDTPTTTAPAITPRNNRDNMLNSSFSADQRHETHHQQNRIHHSAWPHTYVRPRRKWCSVCHRLLVFVSTVRFFLELTGVGCAIDFGTDRACEFLDDAERLVLADKA